MGFPFHAIFLALTISTPSPSWATAIPVVPQPPEQNTPATTTFDANTHTTNLGPNLTVPEDPFNFHISDFPYTVVYSDYRPPTFPPRQAQTFITSTSIALRLQQQAQRASPSTEVPGQKFHYTSPILGRGMQWEISTDEERAPVQRLTWEMVAAAVQGTNEL
ncbi:MAG: hypothetical protein Q9217_006496, partial [Psora testacea]